MDHSRVHSGRFYGKNGDMKDQMKYWIKLVGALGHLSYKTVCGVSISIRSGCPKQITTSTTSESNLVPLFAALNYVSY